MQPMRTSCLLSGWRALSLRIIALILRHRGLIVAAMQEHSQAAESYAAAAARSNDEAVRSFMAGWAHGPADVNFSVTAWSPAGQTHLEPPLQRAKEDGEGPPAKDRQTEARREGPHVTPEARTSSSPIFLHGPTLQPFSSLIHPPYVRLAEHRRRELHGPRWPAGKPSIHICHVPPLQWLMSGAVGSW